MNYDKKMHITKDSYTISLGLAITFAALNIIPIILFVLYPRYYMGIVLLMIVFSAISIGLFISYYIKKKNYLSMMGCRKHQFILNNENDLIELFPQVAVNEKKKKVRINNTLYSFKDILCCELVEDGNVITTIESKRKSSLGKAVLGGALFGTAGAIIGGTSGRVVSRAYNNSFCSRLEIIVTVDNISSPIEYITLIDKNINKRFDEYINAKYEAEKYMGVMKVIINDKQKKN